VLGRIGLFAAALVSAGWLVPAALGVDRVLAFLNEDMARLSVLRNTRPSLALPTEFNAAPNILQAREYLTVAGVWLALVIAGWAIYFVRSRRALQRANSVPAGDLLTAHRHALDHQFTEFAQEIDRHRRDLSNEFGSLGQASESTQGLLQVRFDAVQARLGEVDTAVAHQTETLRAVATRLEGGLQASTAQLGDEIRGAREQAETQHRSEQDQRFVSIHNAVQVLGAQIDARMEAAQTQAEARSERLDAAVQDWSQQMAQGQAQTALQQQEQGEALAARLEERLGDRLGERLGEQLGEQLVGHLTQQVGPQLDERLGERLGALLGELGQRFESKAEARQGEWQAGLDQRLGAGAQRQQEGFDALQALVQALRDQLGEALQLQRDAGSEARRRAESAVDARLAHQEAQTRALTDLAERVEALGRIAQELHGERSAADHERSQALTQQLQGWVEQAQAVARSHSEVLPAPWLAQTEAVLRAVAALEAAQFQVAERAEVAALAAAQAARQAAGEAAGQAAIDAVQQAASQAADAAAQQVATQVATHVAAQVGDAIGRQATAQAEQWQQAVQAMQTMQSALGDVASVAARQALEQVQPQVADEVLQRVASQVVAPLADRATETGAQLGALQEGITWLARQVERSQQVAEQHQLGAEAARETQARQLAELADVAGRVDQQVLALQGQGDAQAARRTEQLQALQQQLAVQAGQAADQQAALAERSRALEAALQGLSQRLDEGWRALERQQRDDWQAHDAALRARLDGLGAQLERTLAQALVQTQAELGSQLGQQFGAQMQGLQERVLAGVPSGEALREPVERLLQVQAGVQALADQVGGHQAASLQQRRDDQALWQQAWQGLAIQVRDELAATRQVLAAPAAQAASAAETAQAGQAEALQRVEALQGAIARLGERFEAQRDAWVQERQAQQAAQTQALQALAVDLERGLGAAQVERVQQQEQRLGDLQALVQRIDQQQQAAQQQRQVEQGAMMQALERRLGALDTLEAQIERLEGLLTRAGVQGVAARLAQIEAILSAQGPARLETRLGQLEAVLTDTSSRIDSRLGELHGLVTQQGAFVETAPAPLTGRLVDERKLQQVFLNLSDLQENLRLERRQLRKKAESLNQPIG
jgi:hypothetical protein